MIECDVAIIGGGPAGSTLGTLLKKRQPDMKVCIFEKEQFPREHVGESLLPGACQVLHEMGVWDKIESEGFPVKIGATYRWGKTDDLWDFELLPSEMFKPQERPAKYKGQRRYTAFQVDRARYDEILLRHAEEQGCEVYEESQVTQFEFDGDKIKSIQLDTGQHIKANWYIDASGTHGVLRRALDIETDQPTSLRNIAFYDYWDDVEWAVEIGDEATRVQVMSIAWGWLWFIPISKTRASVGLVLPAEYYKESGLKPEEIYAKAIASDPNIEALLKRAKQNGKVKGAKDWSFVSKRMYGPNWVLAGEAAGFADPVLAAGLTLTQAGARELSCVLNEIAIGEQDPEWLLQSFEDLQIRRIKQHIQFADFWYSGNGQFSDLKEFTAQLAEKSGLKLTADEAFQWLGTGGFINDDLGTAQVANFALSGVKLIAQMFAGDEASWEISKYNQFQLNAEGAEKIQFPVYRGGRVQPQLALKRGNKILPLAGTFGKVAGLIKARTKLKDLQRSLVRMFPDDNSFSEAVDTLEAMIQEGWVTTKFSKKDELWEIKTEETSTVHMNRDTFIKDSE